MAADSGEARMRELGYKQELNRGFSTFTNCAVSMSIISILTGITGSLNIAWTGGGPVSAVWGWIVVSFFTMFVGLAMAEIVSALPSSGGPYFWATLCSGPKHGPFAAWVTGYFNLLGQVAVTASIDFTLANQISAMITLGTGGAGTGGTILTAKQLLGVYAGILVCHALLNCVSTRICAYLNAFSVCWHVIGAITLIILLPSVAPTRQSASYVFTHFIKWPDSPTGITNNGYLFLVGMLMSQFTITGYDACAHMSEETKNSDRGAPVAIVSAIGLSSVLGFGYILALIFSIQNPADLLSGSANGYVSGQIFADAFTARFGSVTGGVVAMGIPAIAMFCCGMSSVTSNSRMCWSFSRDGGLPFGKYLSRVNSYSGTPINAVMFMVTFAFLLALPLLKSTTAFAAVVSISTIGLYISYALPILMRITFGRTYFVKGPFHLGPFSLVVGWVAVAWVSFITVVFVLPTAYPVTSTTLNYAPVAVGIVALGSLIAWFLPSVGGRHWYKGAQPTLQEDLPFHVHSKDHDHQGLKGFIDANEEEM